MAMGYSIRLDLYGMISENAQRLHASVCDLWLEYAAALADGDGVPDVFKFTELFENEDI